MHCTTRLADFMPAGKAPDGPKALEGAAAPSADQAAVTAAGAAAGGSKRKAWSALDGLVELMAPGAEDLRQEHPEVRVGVCVRVCVCVCACVCDCVCACVCVLRLSVWG